MLDYFSTFLRHGRIDPVEYYIDHTHRVIYVENAKVACTAIKQVLFPAVNYASLGQAAFHQLLRGKASLSMPAEAQDYLVFSVFRHPAQRLVSCYRDKVMRNAAEEERSIFERRFHRTLFKQFGGIDILDPGLDFQSFAKAVARMPDRLSDRHFASQAKLYQAVTQAPRHFVARIENLAGDWAKLQDMTGLPSLPRSNAGKAADGADIAIGNEARAAIARRYAEDFTLLEYEPSTASP